MIPRWIVTPGLDSTLNCDPELNCDLGLGSQFNVQFWLGVIIQRWILTRSHNSTWNSDPSTYLLPVELRLKKVSKFNSVIKIQQLRRVIIQRKIHWILTPGRYSIGGSKFYLTPASRQLSPRFWGFLWIFLNQRTYHDKISHEKNESPSYTFCQYFMNFCPLKHRLLRRKICRGQRHVLKKHRSGSIIAAPCWKYWFNVVFLRIYM